MEFTIADRTNLTTETFYTQANEVLNIFRQLLRFNHVTQYNSDNWRYAGTTNNLRRWQINNRSIVYVTTTTEYPIQILHDELRKKRFVPHNTCSYDDMKTSITKKFNALVRPENRCL